ncbi:MAG: hypothetical protein HN353_02165 [Bdellovibrionales bacterium]|jgi:hypothetical protein|nr:hypothetical protein [Bdellovibrionales bacterium]MBT3525490.1 hypothetical protein [Bdellovibrionales bacterium]MBT7670403.1 hypothetical protein [Bdellovibrionales bacterium]MBT7767520.1 hypothetical protein [Bdellovibrionales bacterium]
MFSQYFKLLCLLLMAWSSLDCVAATLCKRSKAPLFSSNKPLELTIRGDFNKINNPKTPHFFKNIVHSTGELRYRHPKSNREITAQVELSPRGGYRFTKCSMRPLKIKISKEEKKRIKSIERNNLFRKVGHKLKVVNLCRINPTERHIETRKLLIEYYLYRIVSLLSPITFNARLAQIEYQTLKGNSYLNSYAIILEPKKIIAKRCNLNIEPAFWITIDDLGSDPVKIAADTQSQYWPQESTSSKLQFLLLNYFIQNGDHDLSERHNTLALENKDNKNIYFVPYDFDSSDLVTESPTPESELEQWLKELTVNQLAEAHHLMRNIINKQELIFELINNSLLDKTGKAIMRERIKRSLQTIDRAL